MKTMQHHLLVKGFSIVEMMVALTIGLVLMAGMVALLSNASATRRELDKNSRQNENARFAVQALSDDLQMAGFYGEYSAVSTMTLPAALPDPCETADLTVLSEAFPFAVQGYDAPAKSPISCIADANFVAGTDVLVVRRGSSEQLTATPLLGAVYLQANAKDVKLYAGADSFELGALKSDNTVEVIGTAPDGSVPTVYKKDNISGTPTANLNTSPRLAANARQYLVHIYFVSPCSQPSGDVCTSSSDNGNPIPTLKRLELSVGAGGVRQFEMVSLVEGVDDLQIDYGIDTSAGSGDGVIDEYRQCADLTECTLSDWADVMGVRVHVLARNVERTVGYQDKKSYDMGLAGTTAASGDEYKRHVYSQFIRLTNPASRREGI